MNKYAFLAPLALAAASFSSTALAADVKAEADQVNTLNGQLVEVGDRNKFLLGYKPWNVSTNPVALMYGSYQLSVSHSVSDNIALRADIEYLRKYLETNISGFGAGLGAPIYFKKMYDGFLLEPGFRYQNMQSGDVTVSYFGPQMLVGWHWMWDSGWNVALAMGIGRVWASANDTTGDSAKLEGVFPAGYLRVGYAFD